MNKTRRASIAALANDELNHGDLPGWIERIEALRDEEQEAFDNMPEGLQEGERGQAMQEALDKLQEAIDALEAARESIDEASTALGEAAQ